MSPKAAYDLIGDLPQVHVMAGARRAFDCELIFLSDWISSRLTGNQIGPRQLELPPKRPVDDSAGS